MKINIRYQRIHPNAKKLTRGTPGSAGYDAYPVEAGVIPPRSKVNVRLGFAASFDKGYVALLEDRGGMGNKAQTKMAGVVDSDYTGEWMAIIYNATDKPFEYSPDKAIVQVLFLQHADLNDVGEGRPEGMFDVNHSKDGWYTKLPETQRGAGKFGSTDGKTVEASVDFAVGAGVCNENAGSDGGTVHC